MATYKGYFGPRSSANPHLIPQRDAYRDMYARPDRRVEYQLFSSDYFSGADVKLYFGDIWVDEITSLEFVLQENVMPIFGYHSFTYDAIARGQRTIQGSFSINFTTVSYIHQIMENANAIFYALEKGENEGIIRPQYYQNMKLSEILEMLGKESFDQIADEYEKAIWGEPDKEGTILNYANKPYFRQDDLGFDIRIQYGAVSESTGYLSDSYYQKSKEQAPNTTVDILNGVQLTGMAKSGISTDAQGAPIQETYSFIARDLNGVSFTHLYRKKNGAGDQVNDLGTVYRKMQYGPIR